MKKGRPSFEKIPEKKKKTNWIAVLGFAGLVIMVGSVLIYLPLGMKEEERPEERQLTVQDILSAFKENKTMPLTDEQVIELLEQNKTVLRYFYEPYSELCEEMEKSIDTVAKFESVEVDKINVYDHCLGNGTDYIKKYCPDRVPLTVIIRPDKTSLAVPGVADVKRLEGLIKSTLRPKIFYYPGNETLDDFVSALSSVADVLKDNETEVVPSVRIKTEDLVFNEFVQDLNFYLMQSNNVTLYNINEERLLITSNPHLLNVSECNESLQIDVFYSPNSKVFEGYSICNISMNISNCTAVDEENCTVLGNVPNCSFTPGERQIMENLTNISIRYLCLPAVQGDVEVCQNTTAFEDAIELSQKYAISSTPAYIIKYKCKYESIFRNGFSMYENATRELRKRLSELTAY